MRQLDSMVNIGNISQARRVVKSFVQWADNDCDHSQCSDVRIYCAKALVRLGDDESAYELLVQASQSYLLDHDKAIAYWQLGCLYSLEMGSKWQAINLMQNCSQFFRRLSEGHIHFLDRFEDLGDLVNYVGHLKEVVWYKRRQIEVRAVVKLLLEKNVLARPKKVDNITKSRIISIGATRIDTAYVNFIRCNSDGGVARNVAENLALISTEKNLESKVLKPYLFSILGTLLPRGQMLLNDLITSGVNTGGVRQLSKFSSDTYDGSAVPPYTQNFCINQINNQDISKIKNQFRFAYMAFIDANLPGSELELAIKYATDSNIPVGVNPTEIALAPKLIPFLKDLFLIVTNPEEAGQLTERVIKPYIKEEVEDLARQLVSMGVENVVVIVFRGISPMVYPYNPFVCYADSQNSGSIRGWEEEFTKKCKSYGRKRCNDSSNYLCNEFWGAIETCCAYGDFGC